MSLLLLLLLLLGLTGLLGQLRQCGCCSGGDSGRGCGRTGCGRRRRALLLLLLLAPLMLLGSHGEQLLKVRYNVGVNLLKKLSKY
jgi:hypothetical protein